MKNPFSYVFGVLWLLTLPLQAQEKEIFVEKVTNSVVIGPVAGKYLSTSLLRRSWYTWTNCGGYR